MLVAVLGTDAVLAARPASPAQLAAACRRAGFDLVLAAAVGDELIAAEAVRRLAARTGEPAVMCSCPLVEQRLLAPGPELTPFLVALVPPPVAAARYVRTVSHASPRPRITYVGACPGAAGAEIDEWLSPRDLLDLLAGRGATPAEAPGAPDPALARSWTRHHSLPGGVPAPVSLAKHRLVELADEDYAPELAQYLLERRSTLIDLSLRFGCHCAGASGEGARPSVRREVMAHEPPRASTPVLDPDPRVHIPLDRRPPPPPAPRHAGPRASQTSASPGRPRRETGTRPAADAVTKRRSPVTGFFRAFAVGTSGRTRSGKGRALSRTLTLHRRTISGSGPRYTAAPTPQPALPTSLLGRFLGWAKRLLGP